MPTNQKRKSKKPYWREFSTLGKDPTDPQGIRTVKLPIYYLFNTEGTMRGYAQAKANGSWVTAVGRPSVQISNTATTAEEAKKLIEDTIAEWGL